MPKPLHGVLAIAHTPFTDHDEIDAAALKRSVDWAFTVGADGLGTGMVSETLKLTSDERVSLAKMLVEFAGGRGPVFAAVGAESTKQSLGFARAAEAAGCARLSIPRCGRPRRNHVCPPRALVRWFTTSLSTHTQRSTERSGSTIAPPTSHRPGSAPKIFSFGRFSERSNPRRYRRTGPNDAWTAGDNAALWFH